jgi:chemotaxis protein MotB
MGSKSNAPIIIKRKKVSGGDGHHGGAWKVAYADFVTAMMAFFMLMWLLNATTEQQRKGLADYFAPTVAISRTSGGADGNFGGLDIMSDDTLVLSSRGGGFVQSDTSSEQSDQDDDNLSAIAAEVQALRDLEQVLLGQGGESLVAKEALRHVITRLTDEGLVIELFSRPDAQLFEEDSAIPTAVTRDLLAMIANVTDLVPNNLAIAAYVPAQPIVLAQSPVWDLTVSRADSTRSALEAGGLAAVRIARLTGHGDRSPAVDPAISLRNDRIEITILRNLD